MTKTIEQLRAKQAARARARRELRKPVDVPKDHHAWRGICSGCHAEVVIMSPLDPLMIARTPPAVGDCARCDACGVMLRVDTVWESRVEMSIADAGVLRGLLVK